MFNLICGCICFACGIISCLKDNEIGVFIGMGNAILNFVLAAQHYR